MDKAFLWNNLLLAQMHGSETRLLTVGCGEQVFTSRWLIEKHVSQNYHVLIISLRPKANDSWH